MAQGFEELGESRIKTLLNMLQKKQAEILEAFKVENKIIAAKERYHDKHGKLISKNELEKLRADAAAKEQAQLKLKELKK